MDKRRWRATLAVVAVVAFMTSLDNTIVNVALPSIRRDLGMSLAGLQWVVSGYVLAFAGLLLAGGRLADVYGRRRALLTGLAVFTLFSALAGCAQVAWLLVAARIGQGCGAALVLPAGLAVVTAGRSEREQATGASVWMAALGSALALGPVTGGWLAQHLHWSWVFWVNLPPGIIGILIGARAVPETRDPAAPRPDLPGLALSALTLTAVTYAFIEGPGLGPAPLAALAAVIAAAAYGFVVVERRAADPMIDVRFFTDRTFTGGTISQVLWGLALNGAFFFTPMFLQGVLAYSPYRAGLVFLPLAGLLILVTPVTPRLVTRYGAARTVAAGLLLVAAGLARVAFAGPGDTFLDLLPGVAAIGVGSALSAPLTSSVLAAMPSERAGTAGGLLGLAREVSGIFGVAALGVIVTTRQDAARATGAPAPAAFMSGYSAALLTATALTVLAAAISHRTLPRRDRAAVPSSSGTP